MCEPFGGSPDQIACVGPCHVQWSMSFSRVAVRNSARKSAARSRPGAQATRVTAAPSDFRPWRARLLLSAPRAAPARAIAAPALRGCVDLIGRVFGDGAGRGYPAQETSASSSARHRSIWRAHRSLGRLRL
jgi:hypothetical protein